MCIRDSSPEVFFSPRYSTFSQYFHKFQCKFFDIIKCLIKSPFLLLRLSRPESIFIEFKIFGVLARGRLLVSDVIFILYTRLFGHPSEAFFSSKTLKIVRQGMVGRTIFNLLLLKKAETSSVKNEMTSETSKRLRPLVVLFCHS